MKKVIIGIIAVAVFATGAIFVVAQRAGRNGENHFGGHRGAGFGMALRGLDLTDDQKAKVKEIMDTTRGTIQPLMEQMRTNRQNQATVGTDGTFDEAKAQAFANEQSAIMAKVIVERERAKAQVFGLLTDEQKAKAAELRQKFQERMKDHPGFGKGPGKGMEF